MAAHHHDARCVATRQPGDDVHDIDGRSLGMSAHLHQCRVVLDAQTAAARFAITGELLEQIAPCRADAARAAQRVAHGMTSSERD